MDIKTRFSNQYKLLGSATVSLLVAVSVLIMAVPVSAATLVATVDDATTSGTNRFGYTGASWTNCGGCNTGAYQNSFKYGYTTGDKFTFTFSGTQAKLYGYKEKQGGIASVSIDGGAKSDVDFYSATQTLTGTYTTPSLSSGTHVITMTVTGRKAANSISNTINIDKAEVFTGTATDPAPTPTPTPTPTPAPAPSTRGIVSVTLDDGQAGQYLNARPALIRNNLRATYYIPSDSLTWQGHINATQARQLVADGFEIGNHTASHANLPTLPASQIEAEFANSQATLLNQVGVTPTTCAYPYGAVNDTVVSIASKYVRACRGTLGGSNPTTNYVPYRLTVYYVNTSTTATNVRAAADQAIANNTWVIFVYHGVGTVGSSDDVTTATFETHMDALRASGVPVKTVAAVVK